MAKWACSNIRRGISRNWFLLAIPTAILAFKLITDGLVAGGWARGAAAAAVIYAAIQQKRKVRWRRGRAGASTSVWRANVYAVVCVVALGHVRGASCPSFPSAEPRVRIVRVCRWHLPVSVCLSGSRRRPSPPPPPCHSTLMLLCGGCLFAPVLSLCHVA